MSDILGFAVLSGPLWLIVLWLPVSIWLAAETGTDLFFRSQPLT